MTDTIENTLQYDAMRLAVRSLYDAQKLRIEMGNRIAAQVRDGILSEEWNERLSRHLDTLRSAEHGQ